MSTYPPPPPAPPARPTVLGADGLPLPQAPPVIRPAPVIQPPAAPPAVNLPPGATAEPAYPLAEKIIGAGLSAAPNLATMTPGVSDPWLIGWSLALNAGLDWLKNRKHFPEALTPVVMIIGGIVIGWVIYQVVGGDTLQVGLSKGAWIVGQCHTNWVGGKRLGAFAPTSPEKRFGNGNGVKTLAASGVG